MNETELQAAASKYLDEVKALFYSGNATEISYRGNLEQFLETLLPEIDAINEPKRVSVGAPDFVLVRRSQNPQQLELLRSVPLGFIEAKDLKPGILDQKENQSQIERYMDLGNVVHTDGLIWRFYFERKLIKEVSLGHINDQKHLVTTTESLEDLEFYLRQTVETAGRTIRSAKSLALHMADRAKPIRRTILSALEQDLEANERTDLVDQYHAFKETLIHDLSEQDFADIYAETIAYGLFAARYNDDTIETFSLVEAAQKVPQTNPFLRQFFLQIAAYERDVRLDWVLNNFADLFSYADVHKIMSTYGKTTGMNHDPVTHFYETFLGEYDPKRRKARGVYYTPLPVVQYIVRAVDRVLKEEFGLPDGLADDSTVSHTFNVDPYSTSMRKGAKQYTTKTVDIPRVQILDPATGTSTFLNETIKLIADRKAERLGSGWNDYVEKNLLPRIHGFEILMAAYSMAHMRLGLTLAETGYKPSAHSPRLGVYLTNSLEEPAQDEPPLLAMMGMGRVLTEESIAADRVKRDMPIMVVMGNPPYSINSGNLLQNQRRLIDKYKYVDGVKIKERGAIRFEMNLNDDYVKFLAYAENVITNNQHGVLAFINNDNFIDAPTFRGMRNHLLKSFDEIYILDLHGSAKKAEKTDDGDMDSNVFDVEQGVCINIFVKTSKKSSGQHAKVYKADLLGTREFKYDVLSDSQYKVDWNELVPQAPNYDFVERDYRLQGEYFKGIRIDELFAFYSSGIISANDSVNYHLEREDLEQMLNDFKELDVDRIREKYKIRDDTKSWNLSRAVSDVRAMNQRSQLGGITRVAYRPFETRWMNYTGQPMGIMNSPRYPVAQNFLRGENIALTLCRQFKTGKSYQHAFITDLIADTGYVSNRTSETGSMFVLYTIDEAGNRQPNFNTSELSALTINLSVQPSAEGVLDYIYGVLYSPGFRQKYVGFLKTDFPRVPIPKDDAEFVRFSGYGTELRKLHLMKNVEPGFYKFVGEGDGTVEKVRYQLDETSEFTSANADGVVIQQGKLGRVYINDSQYFIGVPDIAWNFYIGGYQPAQKWLKDRKGRQLGYKDIEHYQRIITILMETDRIMKEIG